MRLLVLLVVLSFVSLHHSALVGDSPDVQLFKYNNEIDILLSILTKECPEHLHEINILISILIKECPEKLLQKRELTDYQKLNLELKASHLQFLKQQLLKCRQDKRGSTTSRSMTVATNPAPLCPSFDGDSVFNMQFITYNSPTNKKATGVLCRTDGSPCNISLEICVSLINSKNCEFYHHVTDVVGEKPNSGGSDNFGNLTNPVKINLGNRKWQGANVDISVLERNPADSLRAYHDVEEFSYRLTMAQGSPPKVLKLHGENVSDKTELVVMFTVPCPSPSTILPTTPTTLPTRPTTLPTTPTTLPATPTTLPATSTTLPTTPTTLPTTPTTLPTTPTTLPTTPTTLPTTSTTLPSTPTTLPTTTTSSPVPAECLTATNLTQSWRLDHNGRDIKGGGPHSAYGYACDLYDMGWFRFTGAAGTHMLDKCPKWKSCGTFYSYWTDGTPPQAVGDPAYVTAYAGGVGNCKFNPRRVQVMRCSLSTDHDLIYRYIGRYSTGAVTCGEAFCGMN